MTQAVLADSTQSTTQYVFSDHLPETLAEIRRPVADELSEFRRYFRRAMRTDVRLLDQIVRYVLRQKGKRIRPTLVMLSAKICGNVTEATYRGAALVELLHSATLIHDDVVDNAAKRRGIFSINALWKNKVAVLFGDFLLSRGLLMALEYEDYDLLQTMSDAVRRMSEGELLQIEKSRKLDIDEETYFRIISDKTASLIAACTVSGAISAGAASEDVQRMRDLGEQLGLAFQIRDDLFDYGANGAGKPAGTDLKEKKMTLPLIFALRKADGQTRRRIMRIVRSESKDSADVEAVARFVDEHGGIAHAQAEMRKLTAKAADILLEFPPSESRTAMAGLIEYTVRRSR